MAPQTPTPTTHPDWDTAVPEQGSGPTPPPQVTLPADWASAGSQLFAPPPKVEGVDYAKPLGGPPSPWMPVIKAGLEIGGALLGPEIIGPLKGAQSLPSAVRLAWRMATAGAGAGTGSAVADTLVDPNLGAEPGAPPSVGGILSRAGDAAVTGAEGEGIGAALSLTGKGARRLLSKTKLGNPRSYLTPEGEQAISVLGEDAVKPSQAANSRVLDAADNIMESSLFGQPGRYRQFLEEQRRRIGNLVTRTLDEYGPRATVEQGGAAINRGVERTAAALDTSAGQHLNVAAGSAEAAAANRRALGAGTARSPEETGRLWQTLQDRARQEAVATGNALYDEVDRLGQPLGATVSLQPMLNMAEQQVARAPEMARALSGKAGALPGLVERTGTEVVPPAQASLETFFGAKPGDATEQGRALMQVMERAGITPESIRAREVTFSQAHRIRSEFGKLMADAEQSGNSQLKYLAGQYRDAIEAAMEGAAVGHPELQTAYKSATAQWKYLKQTFDEGLLAEVATKEPRLVVDALIKPGRVADLVAARKAVGAPAWEAVTQAHLDSLLKDANGSWVTGSELAKRLRTLTPETIEAVYGKGRAGRLTEYAKQTLSAEGLGEKGMALAKQAEQIRGSIPPAFRTLAGAIKPNDTEQVAKLRQLVGDADWKTVEAAFAHDLFRTSTGGLKSGKEIYATLEKYSPETLKAVFSRGTDQNLWQAARVLKQVERQRSGVLSWMVPGMQLGFATGAVGLALRGNIDPDTAVKGVLLASAPTALARMVLSPTGRQLLTTGLKAKSAGDIKTATRLAGQLAAWMEKEGLFARLGKGKSGGAPAVFAEVPPQGGRGGGPGPRAEGPPRVSP